MFLVAKTKRYRRTVQRSTPSAANANGHSARRNTLTPSILLLNRAIHTEAQPILYAGNSFALEDTTALHAFLAIIGPKNRATLTDLTIQCWGATKAHKAFNHPALTMLTGAVNLSRLYLDCIVSFKGPKGVAKQIYRDGCHWLEAVGAAKGKSDAAIEIIELSKACLGGSRYQTKQPDGWYSERLEDVGSELRKLLR